MKLVVAGSSGSVGSAVINAALALTSHTVLCLDKKLPETLVEDPRIEYRQVDLSDYGKYLEAIQGADALIHLAAIPGLFQGKWQDGASSAIVHNTNVCLSYNGLQAAAEAGIKRVAIAGSVNAIGGVYSPFEPVYDFFPIDETHPIKAADAYSLSKAIIELQAGSIARAYPDMSVCVLRLHHVCTTKVCPPEHVQRGGRDLWGWVHAEAAGRAFLLALEVQWKGYEVINIIGDTHVAEGFDAEELVTKYHPHAEIRSPLTGKASMYTSEKAEKVLGWKHDGGKLPSK